MITQPTRGHFQKRKYILEHRQEILVLKIIKLEFENHEDF